MTETLRRADLEKIGSIDTKVEMLANNLEVYQDINRQNMATLTAMFEKYGEKIDNLTTELVQVASKQESHNGHIISLLDRQGEQSKQIDRLNVQVALNSDYRARMNALALKYGGAVIMVGAGVWAYVKHGAGQ